MTPAELEIAGAAAFDAAYAFILRREGGYANNPADRGGATMSGVIQATYDGYRDREELPRRPVREITEAETRDIYESYWRGAGCHRFAAHRPRLALAVADFAINSGPQTAGRHLQRALGMPAADRDGLVGPKTAAAAAGCDEAATTQRLLIARAGFFRAIVAKDPTQRTFLKGWLARLRHVARACQVPIAPDYAGHQ